MTNKSNLHINAHWDLDSVPAGETCERGLLLSVSAPDVSAVSETDKSLNLALVIDASGSMRGWRLEAAKEAACGIIECLGDNDRVSVISFSDDVRVHIDGLLMREVDKEGALRSVRSIRTRRMTDLGSGWLSGAEAVANYLGESGCNTGNVVVLSDGKANLGIVEPQKLAHHASELLARGITSSCVGIGNGYSPVQLDAIAEAGGGRLHDSATPDEIIEVLLGEFDAMRQTAATSVEVELVPAPNTNVELLSKLPSDTDMNSVNVRIGAIRGGAKRDTALLVKVPASQTGVVFDFEYRVRWADSGTGKHRESPWFSTKVTVVDPMEYKTLAAERNEVVANKIALLWQAALIFEGIGLNDTGRFEEANELVEQGRQRMQRFIRGLSNGAEFVGELSRWRKRVRAPWHDESGKRDGFVSAKLRMKNEIDYRSSRNRGRRDGM